MHKKNLSETTTILITGGAGFIGSSLADKLLNMGYRVIALDNFNDYYNPTIKHRNITQALKNKRYKLYKGDVEKTNDLKKVFSKNKVDAIVHLAAQVGVRSSIENSLSYTKTDIIGTINILEMMKKYGIKHLTMASSSSVYGNCKADKFSENLNTCKPISPYAATKLADEQICYTYHHLYNLEICILRFFTVYGPRQRPDLAINKFTDLIMTNRPIDMYGDGSTMRDYTYIDDIVNGITASLNYHKKGYDIFNLGRGTSITLKNMITTIEKTLGKKAKIHQLPMQAGDVNKTISDISKAQKLLNYHPKISFEEGIRKFIKWKKNFH